MEFVLAVSLPAPVSVMYIRPFFLWVVPLRGADLRFFPLATHAWAMKGRSIVCISMACAWFAIALSGGSENAYYYADSGSCGDHARAVCAGGGRARRQAGSSWRSFRIGTPQHGHAMVCAGFFAAMAAAPMSRGRT